MIKKFLLLSFLLFCGPTEIMIAQTGANSQMSNTNVILKEKSKGGYKRPKSPSQQQILCTYENGSLKFQFVIPEGECQLTVTDMTTGFSRQYVFDSSAAATVYVGVLTQAHIEISTANGHEYEGWLDMEP